MMLKINKTLPKNKARCYDIGCRIGLATLICGIMPGLMVLSYYITPTQQVSAVGYDLTQISTMQEMTQEVCGNTEVGVSKTLTDTRDGNEYTVAKLSDDKCWMTQNLRIAGGTVMNRTDTDLDPSVYTSDSQTYTLPEATEGGFSDTRFVDSNGAETYMNHQVRNSTDDDYGAYYSWCAATAGTCQIGSYADIQPDTSVIGNPTKSPADTVLVPVNSQATSSICPKGWGLPASMEQQTLINNGIVKRGDFVSNSTTSGYWIGGSMDNSVGGAFFPAVGFINISGIVNFGTIGYYWSGMAANNNIVNASGLYFLNNSTPYIYDANRYAGASVRCLAEGWPSQNVNVVAVKVSPSISIDAATGANVEVDPYEISKEGTITATVRANTTYDVLLSANQTALINPSDPEGKNIPATDSEHPVEEMKNAWGILNSDNITYSGITTTPTKYHNTILYNQDDKSTTHIFNLGVSISPSLPTGTYSTTVTITAVNN